ncbi:MAG TPA: FHA domain-containing protein [Armatimonadota bacterium]|jgi:hypothetical protein
MSDITFVKYCPLCGAENPRQQAFCLRCLDGELATVPVEPRRTSSSQHTATSSTATAATPRCVLELLDAPNTRFALMPGQTIGRTEKADVVLCGIPDLDWISGAHAKLLRRGEQWYIQHIGSTNYIKVDGETYRGHEEVAIYPDSIVLLSLTAFRVRMEG